VTQASTASPIRWPAYREGQLLDVAELQAEQQSRTGALVRHEQNVHTAGVATGLELTAVTAGIVGMLIRPGLAVDGTGRYLVLDRPLTASLADGEDVWVSIVWRSGTTQIELSDTPPPAQADRVQDAWPVVLGQAARSAGAVTVQADAREELRLRATTLSAPAGGSRVLLGGQSGHGSRLFGVRLARGASSGEVTTLNTDGSSHINVETSLDGDVRAGGLVVLGIPVPPPAAALPWSLYRAALTRPDKTVAEQFRLEAGEVKSGIDPHARELLVATGGTGAVKDLLHVDTGGTVTIPGKLVVEGFTTVTGQSGPLAAAATLSSLAAQEADLLAQAQVLLNRLTDTDLRAQLKAGPAAAAPAVTYTMQLASSAAVAVTSVAAYETVVNLSTNKVISQQFVAQGISLPAGSTYDITRTVAVGPHQTRASITVLVIGAGQDGQPRVGTLAFQAST